MLGLAMVASIAAMAFSASSAMAVEEHVQGFCKVKEALCKKENALTASSVTKVLAHSNLAELKNNSFFSTPEKCKSDTTVGVEDMKNPMPGKVEVLTFTECSGPCKKAEAKGLPWSGEVVMTELTVDMLTQVAKEGKALLSECTFGTKCEYGVPTGGSVELLGEGNLVKAEAEPLEYKSGSGEGICGSVGTWTATYEIQTCDLADGNKHTPCYLTLLPVVFP
jgi:hypothetical protein